MKRIVTFLVLFYCFISIVNFCEGKEIVLAWDQNTETNLAGYKVYYSSSYAAVSTKQVAPINLFGRTSNCACLNVDESSMNVVHIGVSAYDAAGNESNLTMGYVLFGNIAGDFNEGTPMNSARVDGLDLTTLGLYFGQTVTHPTYNCGDCAAISSLPLPTAAQKCDLKKDNRIDGFDLMELGLRFGNAAQ